jgi:hypothetical protein
MTSQSKTIVISIDKKWMAGNFLWLGFWDLKGERLINVFSYDWKSVKIQTFPVQIYEMGHMSARE